MVNNKTINNLKKLIEEYNFKGGNKYTLIILFGLLGDFDSIEYSINLKKFIESNHNNLNTFALAIGNEKANVIDYCNSL